MISGCSVIREEEKEDIPQIPEVVEVEKVDPIKEKMKTMSLEEKIGQMFIVGFEGYETDDEIKELIQKRYVGGIIFFDRNIKNAENLLQLMNSLKSLNQNNKAPLFMSVDEEGGRVSRLPKEIKKFPSSMNIGKVNDEEYSLKVGEVTGEKLKAFGFNMNFAPVLDIYSNPKNKVIGDRAFGVNPERVKNLGVATMKGLENEGVIPVVKHFPGHGDTLEDSHLKECDVILIDTTGRSSKNVMQIAELNSFIQKVSADNIHLVISCTTKDKDINSIVQGYKTLNFNSVIITKLDETTTYGSILNILQCAGKPLSFVTTGQNVPDDFKKFEAKEIADLILGEEVIC
jgi:hypothetical protein